MSEVSQPQCVITGAARGIGLAIAHRFHAAGRRTFLVDRDADGVARAAQSLGGASFVADLSDVDACADAARAALAEGPVNVLVNNCAIAPAGDVFEVDATTWDEVFAVNVRSAFLMAKELLPSIITARSGAIVNIASTAGIVAEERNLAYCASKGAIINFTRALALDVARRGVRVNAVCPGSVDTPLLEEFYSEFPDPTEMRAADRAGYPMGRIAAPEEIAEAVFFLASEQAGFVTGTTLVIDGGYTAR